MKKQFLSVNGQGQVFDMSGRIWDASSKSNMQMMQNSLGAEQTVTTLTTILPTVIKTKYYPDNLTPSEFVDINVGQGNPFAQEIMNWTLNVNGDDFESGLINEGQAASHTNSDNFAIEPIKQKTIGWKKNVVYDVMSQGMFDNAARVIEYVQTQYEARKKQYDYGFTQAFFFGLKSQQLNFDGLLNQTTVNSKSDIITKYLKDMTADEFNTFLSKVYAAYQENCNYTAEPTDFVIPAIDYTGLAGTFMSAGFPIPGSTRLEVLENAFKMATGNGNFRVRKLAYGDQVKNASIRGLNKNRYILYKKAPDSVICNVPLAFTVTLPGTCDSYQYTSAAYSRFTTIKALRPLEMLYFDFTNPST